MRGVAGVVEVAVGQDDELQATRVASQAFQLTGEHAPGVGSARVNQDIACPGLEQVTIDRPHVEWERQRDAVDMLTQWIISGSSG